MDFSSIESVLGLASTALGATGKAVSTVEAVRKLLASEKKSGNSEAQTLLNTLATELTAANMMNVQLSEAIKALSRELKKQDDFENEKARYELFQTDQHDIVFRLRGDQANGQPMHFICPVCLNADRLISFISGEGDFKVCQKSSHHTFRFNKTGYARAGRASTDWAV
ncbi:hypothetical protein [Mesorhizobium sp. B2-8-9]|uniref:hypothetical protein n=1 Tax=Mesorhizobium sp. B2-8-9 TaxID=2589899 RepID=UPI00112ABD58|nr:hypothetical protein [Mesorhizobium sp. B2-8-9]TPI79517.1 hypothetical protein FJ423_15080 [Mesorhizobium sp. B2-8-9]